MAVSAADLAGFQSAIDASLPDSGTITRTGLATPIRVLPDKHRAIRLPGIPPSLHLQQWQITVPTTTDLQMHDLVTVAGVGIYSVAQMVIPASQAPCTRAYGYQVGTAVVASTLRQPGALNVGATAANATHLASLNVRPLNGLTIIPALSDFVGDAFGVQLEQPGVIYADWPVSNTENAPVGPNDILVLPGGIQYAVAGVQGWANWRIAITVEMALV